VGSTTASLTKSFDDLRNQAAQALAPTRLPGDPQGVLPFAVDCPAARTALNSLTAASNNAEAAFQAWKANYKNQPRSDLFGLAIARADAVQTLNAVLGALAGPAGAEISSIAGLASSSASQISNSLSVNALKLLGNVVTAVTTAPGLSPPT